MLNKNFKSKILNITSVFVLLLALNVTGVFSQDSSNNSDNSGYGYGYGYGYGADNSTPHAGLGGSSSSGNSSSSGSSNGTGDIAPTPTNTELTIRELVKKDGVLSVYNSKINFIDFSSSSFEKVVKKLNNKFLDIALNAELIEKIVGKEGCAGNLFNKYYVFLQSLKDFSDGNTTNQDVKNKLIDFIKVYNSYKKHLSEIGYFTKLNGIITFIPKLENENLNPIVVKLNAKLDKLLKKYSWQKATKITKAYTRFLLSLKIKLEKNVDFGTRFSKIYIREILKNL